MDVVEVRGRSMAPTLAPGDHLLVVRGRARPGRIVLARDPRDPGRELIKRVERVDEGSVWLTGDNTARSTDARTFGAIAPDEVRWRAIARTWPPGRLGLLGAGPVTPPRHPARSRPGATPPPTS
ncbi:MAG TPA: S26 family signal peptidase [Candidatus Limnocylindria bacterium]